MNDNNVTDVDTPKENQTSNDTVQTQADAPVVSAPQAVTEPAAPAKVVNNPVTLVLQWLTYAFWGWFALAMLWLSFVTFMYFTNTASTSDWSEVVAYPIAAVVVLLLMAGITDFFYARREPAHKAGIATAIMVIHTVIFALCGVGLVVTAVFITLQLLLNSDPSTQGLRSALYMALVGVGIYIVLVVRTVLVAKIKRLPLITLGVLGVVALLFAVLCVVGPMARAIATKQDRQVESALPVVKQSIDDYVREKNKLPTSLHDVTLQDENGEAKDLIEKGVIEYEVKSPVVNQMAYRIGQSTTYYYALCATYTHDKGSSYSRYNDTTPKSDNDVKSYQTYIDDYSHKAGRQCYNLQTTDY